MTRFPAVPTFLMFFLAGTLVALDRPAPAAAPAARLADLIEEAKLNNPAIRSIREKWLASRQDAAIRTWWDQPVLGGEYWFKNRNTMIELSQMIPFPVKTVLAWKAAIAESRAAEAELELKTSAIVADVKKAYYMYYFAGRKAENAAENLSLMKGIAVSAEALYSSGKAPQSDILSADAEAARMQNMLLMLDAERGTARDELASLLGRTNAGSIGDPEFGFENLPDAASVTDISAAPGVRILSAMERSRREEKKMAGWDWVPDFMLGVKYDAMAGAGLTAGLSLPIYLPKRFAELKKAEHEYLSAAAMQVDAANMARSGLDGLTRRYQAGATAGRNYRTVILPLGRQALILDQTSYAAGKISFSALLETSRRYLSDRNDYYDTLAAAWTVLAEIDAIRGIPTPVTGRTE